MAELTKTWLQLFQPVASAVTLIYFYSIMIRTRTNDQPHVIHLIIGALFGLAAVLSMFNPITMGNGVMVDARNLFIGASFGLFGWLAGLLTLAMAVVMRIASGGGGMVLGLIAMVATAVSALIWRSAIAPRIANPPLRYLVLGGMISTQLGVGYWLPEPVRTTYFQNLGPYLIALYVMGSVMLGMLVSTEHLFDAQTSALKRAARTDPLTNLLNRRSVTEAVEMLPSGPAERQGRAIIVFDIDHFKQVNDTFGHTGGDAVLVKATERIKQCLRTGDLFTRLGGDEFAIMLPNTDQGTAVRIASRCRAAVADRAFDAGGKPLSVTISLGVVWTAQQTSLQDLIAAADQALYDAKRRGRNVVATGAYLEGVSQSRKAAA